jgi:CBS-domain-containing membrane protein
MPLRVKKATPKRQEADQEQDEAPARVETKVDEAELSCCLAEIDEVLEKDAEDIEAAIRRRQRQVAKKDWDENVEPVHQASRDCAEDVPYEIYLDLTQKWRQQHRLWMARYSHLFEICCDYPQFYPDDSRYE